MRLSALLRLALILTIISRAPGATASDFERYFGHLLPGSQIDAFTGRPARSKWSMVLDVLDQLNQGAISFDQAKEQLALHHADLSLRVVELPQFLFRGVMAYPHPLVAPLRDVSIPKATFTLTVDDAAIADDIFKAAMRNIGLTPFLIKNRISCLELIVAGRRHEFIPALGKGPLASARDELREPGVFVSYELDRLTDYDWAKFNFKFIADRDMPSLSLWMLASLLNDRRDRSPVWQKLESLGFKDPFRVVGYRHGIPAFEEMALMSAVRALLAMGYELSLANDNQSYFVRPDVLDPAYFDLLYFSTFGSKHQWALEMSPTKSHSNSQSKIKREAFVELYQDFAVAIKVLGDFKQEVIDVPPYPPQPYVELVKGQETPKPLLEAVTRIKRDYAEDFSRTRSRGLKHNWDFSDECAGLLNPAQRTSTRLRSPRSSI